MASKVLTYVGYAAGCLCLPRQRAQANDLLGHAPTGPLRFKLQVKFVYSTAFMIGTQVSPIYDVTVDGLHVTNFQLL